MSVVLYFRSPSKPVRVINGHNKPITKMVMGHDESNPTLITGGSDGRLVEWSVADGSTKLIQGELLEHTVGKPEENFSLTDRPAHFSRF